MVDGKTVVFGVTGGIAAYKACEVARALVNEGVDVHVVMTGAAAEFVRPLTFQTLTGNTVHTELFNLLRESEVGHIALARRGDLVLVAPATANFIGKVAGGIADDLLTTVVMAARVPVTIAPAMNVAMWQNPIVQNNMDRLRELGYKFVEPKEGTLACGEEGQGKLADVERIVAAVYSGLTPKILEGKKLLVTAGPTREALDPVRYLSNRSSGKMGYAMAEVAAWMGASVRLVAGPTALPAPDGVEVVRVETAQEMLAAVTLGLARFDAFVSAAAVADFRPAQTFEQKVKKEHASVEIKLEPTPDILLETAAVKGPLRVGFAAETHSVFDNAAAKLHKKKLAMICANDVSDPRIGFDSDDNAVTVLSVDRDPVHLEKASKREIAARILELIATRLS